MILWSFIKGIPLLNKIPIGTGYRPRMTIVVFKSAIAINCCIYCT